VPHGSANHVVRSPATSATLDTMKLTPRASSSVRVDAMSSHTNPK